MTRINTNRINWWRGGVAGILAFASGFFLARHLVLLGPVPSTAFEAGEEVVSGWFYYNSHLVTLSESVNFFGETMSSSGHDLIESEDTSEYLNFLYVIPPLVLFVMGILLAAGRRRTRTISLAAFDGASIAVGYLIAVIAGVVLFSGSVTTFGATGTLRPDLVTSIIIAGLLYPLIFGALGGIAYFLAQGSIQIKVG